MTPSTPPALPAPSDAQLRGIRRGIEKESLRALPGGALARTPHPAALGAALTHPHITTDLQRQYFHELQIHHHRLQ